MSICSETLSPAIHAFNSMADAGRLCELAGFSDLAREQCRATAGKIAGAALTELDQKVLCAVYCCCNLSPTIGADGRSLKDACAAETLGKVDALSDNKGRYKAQVSYNMREREPIPLMVKDQAGRLTTVPLHHFTDGAHIRHRIDKESAGKKPFQGRDTRRPDLVVVADGEQAPTKDNIVRIFEFKFPNDGWHPGQEAAYRRIGNGRLSVIDDQACDCSEDESQRSTELLAAAESHEAVPSAFERAAWTAAAAALAVATVALALCPLDGPAGEMASGTATAGAAARAMAASGAALRQATATRSAAMMRAVFSGGGRAVPAF